MFVNSISKRSLLLLCVPALLAAQAKKPPTAKPPVQPVSSVPSTYKIGAGDILQVDVWKEPDASASSVVVRPDGKITLPFIKEVDVIDLTPTQVELILAERFGKLINGAEVTVMVKEIRSKKVYLVGAVKKEGSLALLSPMTVLQALSESGGVSDYAKRRKIYVLRTGSKGEERLPFDYEAVLKGEHTEQNIQLRPGDTIVVPQ